MPFCYLKIQNLRGTSEPGESVFTVDNLVSFLCGCLLLVLHVSMLHPVKYALIICAALTDELAAGGGVRPSMAALTYDLLS